MLKPVEIRTPEDIKRAVMDLDPKRSTLHVDIPLAAIMQVREDNHDVTYRVEANTRSKSKRELLLDGLSILKNRIDIEEKLQIEREPIEINGVLMKPASLGNSISGSNWIDPIIKHWLGGYRNGVLICWDLSDGYIYKYDIWEHRLTRIQKEQNG